MSEREKAGQDEHRRPPSRPVSSPRGYFGQASRAATGALRAGISDPVEPASAARPKRPPVYNAGDPALRLFDDLALPMPPTTPLTGAVATLSGIRDGAHEKLFVDLGTTLVRATRHGDEDAGTLRLSLSRTQSAETYGTLLASLRYVNDAAAPTGGVRRIALQIIDAGGEASDLAAVQFGVGERAPDAKAAENAPPSPAAQASAAPAAEPGDPRIVDGETIAFNTGGDYTVFRWPSRLPAPDAPERRAARTPAPSPEAAAGSYFTDGGRLYRLFESPPVRAAPPAGAPLQPGMPAPDAAFAALSAQTPTAANDAVPTPQRAANDAVWMPGRGVPPPGFARASMLRLEDIFGSDMQDAIARRLIDMRIASAGG